MTQLLLRLLLLLLIIVYGTAAHSQKPYLYFNRISTQNGLSHNKVNCIIQDKRGFIWLGTDDGLNRYDGKYFTVFRHQPSNPASLSGNIITSLLEDKDGIIWIATADGGLTKYDYSLPVTQQFKQFKHKQNDSTTIPVNIINSLIEDSYGYLWLASSSFSAIRFNKKTERFEMPVTKGTKTILALSIDNKGILWAGRQGGGILKINTKDLSYETDNRYVNLYATNLPHATVTSLYRDQENNMWMGSWDNVLYRTNIATQKEEIFKKEADENSFPNDDILAFAEDNNERLWMAGRYYGLTIYDKKQNKFFNYRYNASLEGTVADDHVNCIYKDRSGLIWLGTNKGVSVYNPAQQPFVQTFLPLENKNITIYDFYKEKSGKLWLATSEGIFTRTNDSSSFIQKKIIYKGESLAVSKFFIDDDGTWYIGTNYSLFKYNHTANTIALLPHTEDDKVIRKIIDSRVVSIIKDTIDHHPVLLVSPYGHYIAYYDLIRPALGFTYG